MRHAVYRRTQAVTALWVVMPATALGLSVALVLSRDPSLAGGLAFVLGTSALTLAVLGHFTVQVGEGRLAWHYGVFGWPRWQVALEDIVQAEAATSTAWEGWGIRKTRSGMLYNARGLRCVRLQLRDGRTLRLGSDEPERLLAFLRARVPAATAAAPARRAPQPVRR